MYTKIARLNEDKQIVEYVRPTKIMEYDYKGELYVVNSNHVSLSVTTNHRMYTRSAKNGKFNIQEAKKIQGIARSYKKNADNGSGEIDESRIEYFVTKTKSVNGELVKSHKFIIPEYGKLT